MDFEIIGAKTWRLIFLPLGWEMTNNGFVAPNITQGIERITKFATLTALGEVVVSEYKGNVELLIEKTLKEGAKISKSSWETFRKKHSLQMTDRETRSEATCKKKLSATETNEEESHKTKRAKTKEFRGSDKRKPPPASQEEQKITKEKKGIAEPAKLKQGKEDHIKEEGANQDEIDRFKRESGDSKRNGCKRDDTSIPKVM